ncbi:MAG: N-acetyltransferase family protein [Burkholderiaceae bacterium]
MITIRPSRDDDVPAVAALYAHHVLQGTGTFETEPPTPQDIAARRADVLVKRLPWLVAEEDHVVIGYAYCQWFKPRPAYRFSAEDSVYLAPAAMRRGVGRALLAQLEADAVAAGVRRLIAVIGDSANHGSIELHRTCGFQTVGTLASCGWKFGRWLDVVMMDKAVGRGDETAPE